MYKNADKDIINVFNDNEPLGLKTNSIRWLQKKIMRQSLALPREFSNVSEWEAFRSKLRKELPQVIGIPQFPPLKESFLRARIKVGENCILERVDIYADDDYFIPTFIFLPEKPITLPMPALVWNPGWPQTKWETAYLNFAKRMADKGIVTLIVDHAPFGETSFIPRAIPDGMTLVMGMGNVLGISQLALRSAETMRCGEYLRSRKDIDPKKVAVAGLCQGGQDTWLSAALDETFCAAAPICSCSTFSIHFTEMANYRANGDSSPFPFGILKVCDVEHLHAAIAPRPLLVRANLGDDWWPVSGFDAVESFTRKIYHLYGKDALCDFRAEVHEHNLTGPFAEAVELFLERFLLNNPVPQ